MVGFASNLGRTHALRTYSYKSTCASLSVLQIFAGHKSSRDKKFRWMASVWARHSGDSESRAAVESLCVGAQLRDTLSAYDPAIMHPCSDGRLGC